MAISIADDSDLQSPSPPSTLNYIKTVKGKQLYNFLGGGDKSYLGDPKLAGDLMICTKNVGDFGDSRNV